jgi:hypothetical protein
MSFLSRSRDAEPLPSFEEVAASLRADSQELQPLLKLLADKLKADLGRAHVYDNRDSRDPDGPNPKNDPISYLSVKFGEETFTLRYLSGILKTSTDGEKTALTLDEWLAGIHRAAANLAQDRSQAVTQIDSALIQGFSRPELTAVDEAVLEAKGLRQPGRVLDALHDREGTPVYFDDPAPSDHSVEH